MNSSEAVDKVKELKAEIRRRLWKLMEDTDVARFPRPVFGRIPNFVGAESAATKLTSLSQFQEARVVKVNPDAPQRMIRHRALSMGKIVLTPTPRLTGGFLLLDPSELPSKSELRASSIAGSLQLGKRIGLQELPKVDLVVIGCVAVSPDGARLGKGEGYGEIEYAILREKKKIDDKVPVLTTVHDSQIVDNIPWETHDVPVDIIVTPSKLRVTETIFPKPIGISWGRLSEEKLAAIPILQEMKRKAGQ